MDAQIENSESKDVNGTAHTSNRDGSDLLIKLSTAFKEKSQQGQGSGGSAPPQKRDWSSALDLVNEAFEAIRIADERALASEDYREQLEQHHRDQVKALEARLFASEKRAEAAETRAKDAEIWLAKFHDTIVDGFQKTFVSK